MKSAVYNGIENISIQDNPRPEIIDGGILLKIHGCAVCGSDIRTYSFGNGMLNPPWIIGHETVGEVVENKSKNGLKPGQRVAVATAIPCGHCQYCYEGKHTMCSNMLAHGFNFPGGFSEYMAISPYAVERNVLNVIPEHITSEEACLTEPLACVLNGQELLNIGLGDRVLVIGTGAIGCMHIQVAYARGASQVIALEINPARINIAKQYSDYIINPAEVDIKEYLNSSSKEFGDINVVIVACSSAEAQAQAIELAGPRGRICNFGGLPKNNPIANINANQIHYKELTILGSFSSSPRHNKQALQMISSGAVDVKPLISKTVKLEQLEDAILEMKRGDSMKIIVKP